ncbi:hypothetical protein [Pseudophaeobacter arcticus]|uniref:hypothetical protein n=1 Tax=Pseudophaeobacter arcticus TaxID=385492 RepID=UPI00248FB51E|nr:hypothetical protein [Pseudophaeobacter arcticus]
MRNIRTWADIEAARAAGELTSAEEKLIDGCLTGKGCVLGDGTRPTAPSDARTIHADLLRYLITGGGDGCVVHDLGVQLKGAYVPDMLDLDYAQAKGATLLKHSHFEKTIFAQYCHFNTLSLLGSALQQGLNAQGSVIDGSVFLRTGFTAKGRVAFNSAKIGGQLDCHGGQIEVTDGHALNVQNAQISGNVFLSEGFSAKGRVTLGGAKITGQLACVRGQFHAEKGPALYLQGTQAAHFFWRGVTEISGDLDLTGAHFDTLVDDQESWESVKGLSLIGLTYTHITNPGDTAKRLEWLGKGHEMNGEFSPQPYTQLAKVLREMGHDHGARQVLLAKEKRLAQAEKQRGRDRIAAQKAEHAKPAFQKKSQQAQQNSQVELTKLREEQFFATLWSGTLRRLVGYGYKPRLIFYWTGGVILAIAVLSSLTYRLGGMVPNAPVVLLSDEWGRAVIEFNPAEAWLATPAGQHYETFCALAYAADVFIPLVPLGQEVAWAPTTATKLGAVLWVLNWLVKLAGWFITALGAAAIAGVIRRE